MTYWRLLFCEVLFHYIFVVNCMHFAFSVIDSKTNVKYILNKTVI